MTLRESQVHPSVALDPITTDIGTKESDLDLDPRKGESTEDRAMNITELTGDGQDLEKGTIPDTLTKQSGKADKMNINIDNNNNYGVVCMYIIIIVLIFRSALYNP